MKQIKKVALILTIMFCLTGCASQPSKRSDGKTSVDRVLENQIANAEETSEPEEIAEQLNETDSVTSDQETTIISSVDADVDLTVMGSDMIYATVFQMMMEPMTYTGKTVKMQGTYYSSYYEPTNQRYYFVMIEDAAACCSQGIEFVWGDGTHTYPNEYPEDYSEVEVIGVFETYKEEGDDSLYCRIKDASLKVIE